MKQIQEATESILEQLERVIYGKRPTLRRVLVCLLAEGHLLLEDVPGTGKTLLAKALAKALGGKLSRIQGTPDLLPGDVTGSNVYNPKEGDFVFHPGPIFANILLVDEINRATPRAQAALLECMAERQVSVEGHTYPLPEPFFVLATQNPIEYEGTFPLPEAQLDRFLMRLVLGYPSLKAEEEMLVRSEKDDPLSEVEQVVDAGQLATIQREVRNVFVHPDVRSFLVRSVSGTRASKELVLGASPRATKGLFRAAQAHAAICGRDHVLPDDVKLLYPSVLYHRVILSAEVRLGGRTVERVVDEAVGMAPAPVKGLGVPLVLEEG